MSALRELSRWIRDYGHDPRHIDRLLSNRFTWHQLWTAMDIIDDVELALAAYLSGDFPEDLGELYLRVYGILQCLFVQQDALYDLIRAIHPAKSINVKDILKEVREARNVSVGHPTQLRRNGALSAHSMSRASVSKDGFDLLSYPEKDGKVFLHVPVRALVEKQREGTVRILTEVVTELKEQDARHRAEFRDKKLVEAFSQVPYAFEKIFEELRDNSVAVLARWGVEHLQRSLEIFEGLLNERGLGVDSYDSVKYLYEEIEHPMTQLSAFLAEQHSEILSTKTAAVFANALSSLFDELMDIAAEIDEEYAVVSQPEGISN